MLSADYQRCTQLVFIASRFKRIQGYLGRFHDGVSLDQPSRCPHCRYDLFRRVGDVTCCNHVDVGFVDDLPAFFDFRSFQTNNQRHVKVERFVRLDQGVGDRRSAHAAAEGVDEHAFHFFII